MTEYVFESGWRGQIEKTENDTYITIFDEDNSLVITESFRYAADLNLVLERLLEEVIKCQ